MNHDKIAAQKLPEMKNAIKDVNKP